MEAWDIRGRNSDILEHIGITKEVVLAFLKHIKVDKSLWPDQVYPRTFWEGALDDLLEDWRVANSVFLLRNGYKESQGTIGL